MTSRRRFISLVPLAPLIGAATFARAAAPMLDPKDPLAVAQGYVPDVSKIDKAKSPKYVPGEECDNCALYQGAAGSPAGPCPIYSGKMVPAKAWCSVYVKKA